MITNHTARLKIWNNSQLQSIRNQNIHQTDILYEGNNNKSQGDNPRVIDKQ